MEMIPSSFISNTLESYLTRIKTGSRIIYWIIIITVTASLALLPLISVDVAVRIKGYFQSELNRQVVYSPSYGRVVFTSIKDGATVHKGDTLFIIESRSATAQKKALEERFRENNSCIRDLEMLVRIEKPGNQFTTEAFTMRRYFTEYTNFLKSWTSRLQTYKGSKTEFERAVLLHDQEIIPDAEYENRLFAFRTEEEELNRVLSYQISLWQADLMQRRNEEISLRAELGKYQEDLDNRIVTAPLTGHIIQSSDIQAGSVVSANQQIAEISPSGDLIATCFVKPGDIGLINSRQMVRIQVDAFNYNEWGILNASIIDISDDLVIDEGASVFFRIKCRPENTFLTLKNGIRAELKKGMSFTGRIVITRRTLFNLLFDRADKWLNPYLVRDNRI